MGASSSKQNEIDESVFAKTKGPSIFELANDGDQDAIEKMGDYYNAQYINLNKNKGRSLVTDGLKYKIARWYEKSNTITCKYKLALLCINENDIKKAIELLHDVIQNFGNLGIKDNYDKQYKYAYFELARLYDNMDKYHDAIHFYKMQYIFLIQIKSYNEINKGTIDDIDKVNQITNSSRQNIGTLTIMINTKEVVRLQKEINRYLMKDKIYYPISDISKPPFDLDNINLQILCNELLAYAELCRSDNNVNRALDYYETIIDICRIKNINMKLYPKFDVNDIINDLYKQNCGDSLKISRLKKKLSHIKINRLVL